MCLDATSAVGCQGVGKYRVQQQWCMAEQVVEQIWLGDVIELIGTANPPGHREAAVGQMLEKGQFGEQTFDPDQLPASGLRGHLIDVGDRKSTRLNSSH